MHKLVRKPVGEFRASAPDRSLRIRGRPFREPPGEDFAIRSGNIDCVTVAEVTRNLNRAGGQQRHASVDERPPSAFVDSDAPDHVDGKGDPKLARR